MKFSVGDIIYFPYDEDVGYITECGFDSLNQKGFITIEWVSKKRFINQSFLMTVREEINKGNWKHFPVKRV